MKADIKIKWLAALRSGLFKQTQSTLFRAKGDVIKRYLTDEHPRIVEEDCYCCLGVLCKVLGLGFIAPNGRQYLQDSSGSITGCWAGLSDEAMQKADIHDTMRLVGMNDNDGADFNEIAEYIDENF